MDGGFDQNCLSLRRMVCSGLVLVWQLPWKGMVRKNMVRIWRACEDVFDIFRNSAVEGFSSGAWWWWKLGRVAA